MNILVVLVPAALCLGLLGLLAFFWCVRSEQFDDPDGAARRILEDDRAPADKSSPPARVATASSLDPARHSKSGSE